ncbi:hypothetical protein [Rahnella aceris]|uniref:hypothetical protein n=1 Tax=Rahnella sp. (strain Y9602) TaxID=2703885 RepID=UPI001F53CDA7|nr:hypothetical protein [Rahnella aceris]UNK53396.1 hypothetical protein MNO10_00680 [Rahnella aceris]
MDKAKDVPELKLGADSCNSRVIRHFQNNRDQAHSCHAICSTAARAPFKCSPLLFSAPELKKGSACMNTVRGKEKQEMKNGERRKPVPQGYGTDAKIMRFLLQA